MAKRRKKRCKRALAVCDVVKGGKIKNCRKLRRGKKRRGGKRRKK